MSYRTQPLTHGRNQNSRPSRLCRLPRLSPSCPSLPLLRQRRQASSLASPAISLSPARCLPSPSLSLPSSRPLPSLSFTLSSLLPPTAFLSFRLSSLLLPLPSLSLPLSSLLPPVAFPLLLSLFPPPARRPCRPPLSLSPTHTALCPSRPFVTSNSDVSSADVFFSTDNSIPPSPAPMSHRLLQRRRLHRTSKYPPSPSLSSVYPPASPSRCLRLAPLPPLSAFPLPPAHCLPSPSLSLPSRPLPPPLPLPPPNDNDLACISIAVSPIAISPTSSLIICVSTVFSINFKDFIQFHVSKKHHEHSVMFYPIKK